MTLTAAVNIGGVQQSSGTLVACVGTEVRGFQSTPSEPPSGSYSGTKVYQITLYADEDGEKVSFYFLVGSATTMLSETLTFKKKGNEGSVRSPMVLNGVAVSPLPRLPPS